MVRKISSCRNILNHGEEEHKTNGDKKKHIYMNVDLYRIMEG